LHLLDLDILFKLISRSKLNYSRNQHLWPLSLPFHVCINLVPSRSCIVCFAVVQLFMSLYYLGASSRGCIPWCTIRLWLLQLQAIWCIYIVIAIFFADCCVLIYLTYIVPKFLSNTSIKYECLNLYHEMQCIDITPSASLFFLILTRNHLTVSLFTLNAGVSFVAYLYEQL